MTNEEAKAIIRKEYLCVDRDCDIEKNCGRCDLMMPSKDPILEAYKMAMDALEQLQTCVTCRNEDTYHCAECENKSDYEQAQADGEYISRQAVMDCYKKWQPYMATKLHEFEKELSELPSVAIPPDHDGCEDCRWQSQSETEMPCKQCMHNYTDEWEREKPTDTITMTREEFSEKLMEHYRQGRADEKAYQNGEIMQSFNPD